MLKDTIVLFFILRNILTEERLLRIFFFSDLFNVCRYNISFLYLEEPYIYSNHKRSKTAVPFDFIYYLIVFLRKFMGSEMSYIDIDRKIGSFIKKIFLEK